MSNENKKNHSSLIVSYDFPTNSYDFHISFSILGKWEESSTTRPDLRRPQKMGYGTTNMGYGTTNADAGVGIGMLKGDSGI